MEFDYYSPSETFVVLTADQFVGRDDGLLEQQNRDRGAGGAGGASAPPIILEKNNKRAPGRFEVGTGTPLFPVTPKQVYRRIYFKAPELIVSPIEERFDQPSFKAYANMESLLIGVLNSQDVSSQIDYMKESYADDVRTGYLFSQLEILKVLIKDAQIYCFGDVLKAVKSLTDHERRMITEVIVICKLLLCYR